MKRVGAGLALALAVALSGCQDAPVGAPTTEGFAQQREELKKSIAKKKKKAGQKQKVATVEVSGDEAEVGGYGDVGEGYVYDASGKRDPFRSFQFVDDEVPKTGFGPLGDYEVAQLELVAVVWDASRPKALVADPGGRSFIIGEGSQIGKNSGRVIHIGDNLVLVKETYVDFEGSQSTKDVEMRIRRSQGG